jgi:3'(2'), 5'-bisphosphate nucleotidase
MLFEKSVMKSLLPQIIAIAREAGAAIMAVYADPSIAVMSKDDHSPLTQADLAAHNIIC